MAYCFREAAANLSSRRSRRAFLNLTLAVAVFIIATNEGGNAEERFGTACGIERWDVKVLMDRGAEAAARGPAIDSTVSHLVGLRAPHDPAALTARVGPLETTLWRVRARLIGFRLEPDSDFHLVLADPKTGESIVGEIPAPYCSNFSSGRAFSSARAAVESLAHHAAERKFWWLDYHGTAPPEVTVTGVGFWDTRHGQRGVSRNGAELHPVIYISH